MHNNTGILLHRCQDWTDSSRESFQGLQLPILHKWCSYGFPQSPLTRKQYKMKETESNPLYPSSFKPAYILPAPQLDVIKNFLERP